MNNISATGVWNDTNRDAFYARYVYFDTGLADALVELFADATVVDLGCGVGKYVTYLQESGIDCDGYDGNKSVERFTFGVCKSWDLTTPRTLERKYDWVLSLEVAEHIPAEHEKTYIQNLVSNSMEGIVLSWATPDQGGDGHVNGKDRDDVIYLLSLHGFEVDEEWTGYLQTNATLSWFKKNIIVFRRI